MTVHEWRSPSERAHDLQQLVAGVLTEHRHKAPRVQARLVLDAIHQRTRNGPDVPVVVCDPDDERPEPAAWVEFAERPDAVTKLLDAGVATTRNRTHAAMRALGLDPTDIRAVVIERDFVRIFRYDPPFRESIPQTMPILKDKTA